MMDSAAAYKSATIGKRQPKGRKAVGVRTRYGSSSKGGIDNTLTLPLTGTKYYKTQAPGRRYTMSAVPIYTIASGNA